MKPGLPWSVKGVEPDAREAAKAAARRDGVTLGVWLNRTIYANSGEEAASPQDAETSSKPAAATRTGPAGRKSTKKWSNWAGCTCWAPSITTPGA